MRKLTAVIFFCFAFLFANAETFIVTSNADSGPGTLRDAIKLANTNGTATADKIIFNLPDVTVAGRRITLESALPELTSNIVIDASSQPGTAFGVSDARVELYFVYSTGTDQRVIRIYNCTNIGIYALKFTDNITWTAWYKETTCIRIEGSSDIEIGSAGKGNVMINWIHAIRGYANVGTANEYKYNKNIKVNSNFIGLNDDGLTPVGDGDLLEFSRIENIEIGNADPLSGNVLAATRRRISISGTRGKVLIAHNKIGTNYTGTAMLSMPYGESNHLHDNIRIANSPYYYEIEYITDIKIINNLITGTCGNGIYLMGYGKKFYIQGNKIGTDITGTVRLNQTMDFGIRIENCRSGIIGVENDEATEKNIIAFSKVGSSGVGIPIGSGILLASSLGITVSRNSTFCNQYGSIYLALSGGYTRPVASINSITPTTIAGKAPPLSKIELFKDDSCENCEGKIFFDTTRADAAGNWSKTNLNTQGVVVTATDTNRLTSEFSTAKYAVSNFVLKDATCGRNNGSIKGMQIVSGTWWQWEDGNGNIVSWDSALTNAAPGRYRLVIGIGNHTCTVATNFFEIRNLSLPSSITPSVTPASCGLSNGRLNAQYDTYSFTGKWLNASGDSIGTGFMLNNIMPGSYYLKMAVLNDTACNKVYGPFLVQNQSGPSLQTTAMKITPSVCGRSNGSIRQITAENVTGAFFVQWVDSLNKGVTNSFDLLNVPAGKYRLKFKDASGCDTIVTPFYIVSNTGTITIDTTARQIKPATCKGNTGSIANITVTGANRFEWKDAVTGALVGTTLSISGLPAGRYQLTAINDLGCTQSSGLFTIPQAPMIPIGVQGFTSKLAFCGLPNGTLEPKAFSADTSHFSFRWVDSATNQTISRYTNVFGIFGSTYLLYATDSNGCERHIFTTVLRNAPVPAFNYANMQVIPDNCLSGKGGVKGIIVENLFNGTASYVWLNGANDPVGNAINAQNLTAGTYRLKATDLMGCSVFSNPIEVANINTALAAPQYDGQTILKGTTATVTVKNMQTGVYQLFDNPVATTPMQENTTGTFTTPVLTDDKTYYVRYISGVCTSDKVAVTIKVVDKNAVYVPTAFTPNGDGKNDLLKAIPVGRVKLLYFTVYNRWGGVVFTTSEFSRWWNGTFQGIPAETGSYVWILKAVDEISGLPMEQKGTVTIIR